MSSDFNQLNLDLSETLSELQGRVRSAPASPIHRVALVELFAVLGQWDRALTQLNVAKELDPSLLVMEQVYGAALRCEVLRAEVFAGKRSPLVFGQPEEWIALLIESLRLSADNKQTEADDLRSAALEAATATAGALQSATPQQATGPAGAEARRFEWIADADSRLGPVLEAIVNGRYYWVPFRNIRMISIEPPASLRDLVWTPARFQWANGGEAMGLIPARYPGTEAREDDALRMARKTEWVPASPETSTGLGQRMLATDQDDIAILDVRRIDLDVEAQDPASTTDAGAARA